MAEGLQYSARKEEDMTITLLTIDKVHADWIKKVSALYNLNIDLEVDRDYRDFIDNEEFLYYNAQFDNDDFHLKILKNSIIIYPVYQNALREGMQFNISEIGQLIIE